MAQCDFLEYRGGVFSGGYYCLKKDDYLDKETVNNYCDNSLAYRDCPIFRGSSSSGCYLTSACVAHRGLADDCMELTTLRGFRDGYLASSDRGRKDILDYYSTAPGIVDAIDASDDADKIYEDLYTDTILPCVELIQKGRFEETHNRYRRMVDTLKSKFL